VRKLAFGPENDYVRHFGYYHERLRPYVDQCQAFALEGAPIMVPATQAALDERNATFRAYAAKFAT
jgi:hypothetical protein